MVVKWSKSAHEWLSSRCLICGAAGEPGRDICVGCRRELPWLGRAACACCAEALAQGAHRCGRCQRHPPAFARTRAVFTYAEPVSHLIQELKFDARLHVARLLGELMADSLAAGAVDEWPDLLIPVPLHARRLRQRGFNQSVELGRFVARELGLPLLVDGCRRLRATAPQVGKSARQRRANLAAAFTVSADVAGRRVALLDDVMTTGSTVDLLARAVRRAGASQVQVWVCARASLEHNLR